MKGLRPLDFGLWILDFGLWVTEIEGKALSPKPEVQSPKT